MKSAKSEIKPTRRAEIGHERRNRTLERLVQAALQVVASQGFDLPVIDDFIQAAGVSRGTFYNYFKTKEELVSLLCQRINRDRSRHHDHIRAEVQDQAERLVVGVRLNLRRALEHPDWARVYAQERVRMAGGANAEEYGPKREIIEAMKAGRIREQPVDFALDVFYGILYQGLARAISGRGPPDLDQRVATVVLAALGMPYDEAQQIAGRALPPDAADNAIPDTQKPKDRQRRRRRQPAI